jgi:putative nucleotidyltransferase with HDIG domain
MALCPQDALHHQEGDVLIHTKMVVDALINHRDWLELPKDRQMKLFWACVLHDIGKPATTKVEDGRITAKGHSRTGAMIARELLWHASAPFAFREEICGIITSHQLPFWLIERDHPARLAMQTSWTCNTADLCLHAKADAMGRICADSQDILDRVSLAEATFEEANCFGKARPFANDESRVSWVEKEDRDPDFSAFENHMLTVTMMSGLPGAGKDYWISQNEPKQPVVSLDDIRRELGIKATDNQGRVIQAAKERARGHLRSGTDFIWNATDITRQIRTPILSLFRDYGARTRIVYIEPSPTALKKQNSERQSRIPDAAIDKLAAKLEPPSQLEAHEVLYIV